MPRNGLQRLREVLEFTEIYKENSQDICLREARCMDYQLEHILEPRGGQLRLSGGRHQSGLPQADLAGL